MSRSNSKPTFSNAQETWQAKHVLSGYGTKRNEREQECVFNKHLTAGVFPPANVAKKSFFGHVSLSIKEGIYSGEEHFRAIANITLSKPRR